MVRIYYYFVYWFKKQKSLLKDIHCEGKGKLKIHPSTHLLLKKSKIIIENGIFEVGMVHGKLGGGGIDPFKDNCRIHLTNSTLKIIGTVSLYPGCRIIGNNAEIVIKNNTKINAPSWIIADNKIEIGENCLISYNVSIRDNDGHKHSGNENIVKERNKEVIIGNNCWIGQNVIILKGVNIGSGAIISSGSIINKDVQPKTLVGNYGTVIRENVKWNE